MSKEFSRSRRVGEQIQRELAELIQRELKDPRIGFVTVSAVEVSRDMTHAKVYVTELTQQANHKEMLAALGHASGFLRRELGQRMRLRTVPELHFIYDKSIEEAVSKDQHKDEE